MLRNAPIDEILKEARAAFAAKRPLTFQAHQNASEFLPGGNTRTVLYHGPFPIRIAHGEGAFIEDLDGHRYLNLLGEYTAGVFGHSNPVVRRAVVEALDNGVNLGAHNTQEPRLAELISRRFPAIRKVRFTNSGTEANLMAISTARAVTGRKKVLVFKGGYHGALLYFGDGESPTNAPFPYLVGDYNRIGSVQAVMAAHGSEVACIIVEPMMGAAGCIPGDPAFLRALRDEADRAGCMLIFDEVMTSRFGRHGAHGMLDIAPDLITLGKWVGGGMSFGAFGGRAELMDHYDPSRPGALSHAGTFNNNTISMSAGIAALTEAFTPDIAEDLHSRGDELKTRLNGIFADHDVSLQAIGFGSLMNIHAMTGAIRNVDDLKRNDAAMKELLFLDLLDRGFYIANRGFIALSTAVTPPDLRDFENAVDRIVGERKPQFQSGRSRAV